MARFWLVAAALAWIWVAVLPAQQPDVIHLPWKQWQVHAGNDPACAEVKSAQCKLEPIGGAPAIDGWYRIELTLPGELRPQQTKPGTGEQLGLLMQGLDPVYSVYVNGVKIGGSGSFLTRRGPQDARTILRFPADIPVDQGSDRGWDRGWDRNSIWAQPQHLTIAVHALGIDTSRTVEGFAPVLAPIDHLETVRDADTLAYLRRSWQHYLCYAALGGAGCVFFLLFAVNTRLREYAWLGAILGQLPMLRLGELASVVDLGLPSWMGLAIFCFFNGIGAFLGVEFIFAFLGRPVPRIFRAVQLLGALDLLQLLLFLPLSPAHFDPLAAFLEGPGIHYALIGAILIEAFAWLLLVPGCFRSRLPEMRAIGAAVLFLTFVEGNRQAHNFGLPNVPQQFPLHGLDFDLRPVAYLMFALVMLGAMTIRLRRIQDRNRAIEQEMAAAHTVQQILIPDYLPTIPGLTIESAYLPAQEVGGDFFQILPLGRYWSERGFQTVSTNGEPESFPAFLVIGDVSGKGLKAAMTVSLIVGTLRTYAEFCTGPAELLAGLNRRLNGRGDGIATCLVLMISPGGKVTIANAGHPNPYLNGVEIATECNFPLGITLEIAYGETALQLEPQQQLTLVTDGVIEARRALTRELFGFERTLAVSRESSAKIADAARDFGAGAAQTDDITVLTVVRNA